MYFQSFNNYTLLRVSCHVAFQYKNISNTKYKIQIQKYYQIPHIADQRPQQVLNTKVLSNSAQS